MQLAFRAAQAAAQRTAAFGLNGDNAALGDGSDDRGGSLCGRGGEGRGAGAVNRDHRTDIRRAQRTAGGHADIDIRAYIDSVRGRSSESGAVGRRCPAYGMLENHYHSVVSSDNKLDRCIVQTRL
jgi:hypothetical protein